MIITYKFRITEVFAVHFVFVLQKYTFSVIRPNLFTKTFGRVANCSYFCSQT